jgi:DNA-binding NtrC family response regulator
LIVEDEIHARTGLTELIESWGYRTEGAADGVEGLEKAIAWKPAIVVTDLKMPRMDGMALLNRIGELPDHVAVVMMTAQGSIESAVEAMRRGAFDYVPKPVDPLRLRTILQNASRQHVETETARVGNSQRLRPDTGTLGPLVGTSERMKQVFSLIERIAPSNVSVLVTGESGTGKELVARALHELSSRHNKAFVAVNCAAIPETLIESEIFGHEKGAFTGALERRAGCFELAEEGTLLLDEIGEMPAATQAKLLRVLEDRKLRRLGSKTETPVDVRVVAATNKDLPGEVREKRFREDLYYRLNVVHIDMPPLRQRGNDVVLLAEHFLRRFARENDRRLERFSDAARAKLVAHRWPGNVRELENAIERAVVFTDGDQVEADALPFDAVPATIEGGPRVPGATMAELEKHAILTTLEAVGGSTSKAAEMLDISARTIQYRLHEYGIGASRGKS